MIPDALGLTCAAVRVVYRAHTRTGRQDTVALDGVTFGASAGEIVSIVGPSGCGKSTLLRVLAGLVAPTSGSVRLGEPAAAASTPTALVFQEHGLFPWMSVTDNVAFGLEMSGMSAPERRRRAAAVVERVGLARFADSFPPELSVGMGQRAGIARALVSDAPILLMDEPFGALDAQTKRLLQDELLDLLAGEPKLVVFVTHDIVEAVHLGDRVLVMSRRPGRILDDVPVPEPRPRPRGHEESACARSIVRHIWSRLEDDVRRELESAR